MKIMFLMAGSAIQTNKESYPLYMTEINDKLILEEQISYSSELNPSEMLFCVKALDVKQYKIDQIITQLVSCSKIIQVSGQTRGAICTALLGMEYINSDEELLLLSVDDFIGFSGAEIVNTFRSRNCDAGVVSFTSIHPRYSFVKTDYDLNVIEAAEKRPISKNALASFYYFKKGSDFVDCAMEVIRKDNPVNDSFYISQTLNEMILKQKLIGMFKIENKYFHPLKTESQLAQYLLEVKESRESK